MNRINSSSRLQVFFFIFGFRWLCHLSLHCLPILPGRCSAILVHFWGPFSYTSLKTRASSSILQGPFTSSGLRTFCHLWRHCTSVRPSRHSAIFFQFLLLYFYTAMVSYSSSSLVQCPLLAPSWYLVGPVLYRFGFSLYLLIIYCYFDIAKLSR